MALSQGVAAESGCDPERPLRGPDYHAAHFPGGVASTNRIPWFSGSSIESESPATLPRSVSVTLFVMLCAEFVAA